MSGDGDLDEGAGGGGGDGVLDGPGKVLTIGGGDEMLGQRSENKFLPLPLNPEKADLSEGMVGLWYGLGRSNGLLLPRPTGAGGVWRWSPDPRMGLERRIGDLKGSVLPTSA